jgi:exoribonuclease-2
MSDSVHYPTPGCIVEYMEGNAPQIALVTEGAGEKLRLLLPNRRETRLAAQRLLPWLGPLHRPDMNKEDSVRLLYAHKKTREDMEARISALDVWETAQGEVALAPAKWFAELFTAAPDTDTVAAYGHALLACKSHFRFQPPDFQVFPAELVEKRLAEHRARQEREDLISGGATFFRFLWDVACKKCELSPAAPWPAPDVLQRLKELLRAKMIDPECQEHEESLWRTLVKGLPDVPHLPLQLLVALGELPPHHNFWLDRAGYEPGDGWWKACADEVEATRAASPGANLPVCDLPFISIDSASTRDVDDAFYVEPDGTGFTLTLALACPALFWPFGGALDNAVLRRGTSIYLPEGNCHMLPEILGTGCFSLLAENTRPALCVRASVDGQGTARACEPFIANVRLAANLTFQDCQAVLDNDGDSGTTPAARHAPQLRLGLEMANLLRQSRIAAGAVIMDRPEPVITLRGEGQNITVDIAQEPPSPDAQFLVAEMMILAGAAVARWAQNHKLPMLHRTQDVALPREFAGIWTSPQDMARIMRSLTASCLEVQPRPHAALGVDCYTPVTSPLRRYADLVNESQALHFLQTGAPLRSDTELSHLLRVLGPALEAAGHVQRFRPRYWKLLYFRQKGDNLWWPGVITEENDAFVSVSLQSQGLFVRGKRHLFDERAYPGMAVDVRVGKVHPLYNEIQIVEAVTQ